MTNIAAILGLFSSPSPSSASATAPVGHVIRGAFPYDFFKKNPDFADPEFMKLLADIECDPKWRPVFCGDLTAHGDDHSRADLALCGEFMRRGLGDLATDTAMRASALYRAKWERDDYRLMTLQKARSSVSSHTPASSLPGSTTRLDVSQAQLLISTATPPPRDWFFSGMLVPGKSAILAGFGGSSKTQLAIQLAIATALGMPFAGRPLKPGSSMLICGEEDRAELTRRVNAVVRYEKLGPGQIALVQSRLHAFPMEGEDIRLTHKKQYGEFVTTDFGQATIDAAVQIDGLRLIVLDHAALLHGGEFNAKEDVTLTMRAINRIAKETGAAVLVLAHAPKSASNQDESDANMVAGSTAFVDQARAAWVLARMREGEARKLKIAEADRHKFVSLKVVKSNYGPSDDVFWFRRHSFDDVGLLEHLHLVPPPPTSNAAATLRTNILAIVRAQPGAYPRNIFDYIAYRTLLEFRQEFKRDPLDVGFDPDTITMMIKASLHFFMKQSGANMDPGIFVNLGKATMSPEPRQQERAMVPFSPTLPDITKRKPERMFSGGLGSLTAFFCRNVPSIANGVSKGPSIISYPYVFAIFDTEMQRPVHFITLERSSLANTVALCEFRSDGMHTVLDIKGQKYLDEHQFLGAAYLYGGRAVSASFIQLKAA